MANKSSNTLNQYTSVTTDGNPATVTHYTYDAYGIPYLVDPATGAQTQVAAGQPYLFTGRRFDFETGLYYYRARYYSATLGRFLQTDPIGYEDQMNLYAYVGNDPVNAADPSGEWVVAIKVKIDFVAAWGFSLEGGIYVGTDSEGNFDAGLTGAAEVGTGFDVNVGVVAAVGDPDATTDDLDGTFSEVEASAGSFVAGRSVTPGADATQEEDYSPEKITSDVVKDEGKGITEFGVEVGTSEVVSGSATKGVSGKFGISDVKRIISGDKNKKESGNGRSKEEEMM